MDNLTGYDKCLYIYNNLYDLLKKVSDKSNNGIIKIIEDMFDLLEGQVDLFE